MPTYKLTYFGFRGRAEICRLLFAYGDIPYEDCRITFEQWGALKPQQPFKGGLPTLTIDGVVYTQSLAMARYAANLVGLGGDSPLDQLRADMILAQISDMMTLIGPIVNMTKDKTERKQKADAFAKDEMPKTLDRLEDMVNEHGYLVSDKLNYADVYWMSAYDLLKIFDLSKYPKLLGLAKRVGAIPKIENWVKTRPETRG